MEYTYKKERRSFGQQHNFQDKDEMLFTETSNRDMSRDYILRNPIDRMTQFTKQMSASMANTERATFKHCGITHNEGGWPKDINMQDPEQTVRSVWSTYRYRLAWKKFTLM